jgi:molybdate transport system regulatory protein
MKTASHTGMVAAKTGRSIDPVQLQSLETCFRVWVESASGAHRKRSRKRILVIFLLIRYTGARLNEVLSLDPEHDIDFQNRRVFIRKGDLKHDGAREIRISDALADEIQILLGELQRIKTDPDFFRIDPAHVRRKFYDCAEAAGIPRELGSPEAIRKSRAVELMQSNVPLPVVQKIMGHSTPNLAASYVDFSEEEIRKIERLHVELENQRKTSARNSFFGKINRVQIGDVQAVVEILSVDGQSIWSVVTNDSQSRLGLNPGCLVAVEVKAPWVVLYKGTEEPQCSAENRFMGKVVRVLKGKTNSEVVVQISKSTELCSILTEKSRKMMGVEPSDSVWAVFNAAMTVIHID